MNSGDNFSLFVMMANEDAVQKFKEMVREQEPINGVVQPPVRPPEYKTVRNTDSLQFILKNVNFMFKQESAWPFRNPVNALKLGIQDYHVIVKYPMDLTTVKKRIENCYYYNAKECITDIQMIFFNCYTYNKPGDLVVQEAKRLENVFVTWMKNIPKQEIEIPVVKKLTSSSIKRKSDSSMGAPKVNDATPGCSKEMDDIHHFQAPVTPLSSKSTRGVKRKIDAILPSAKLQKPSAKLQKTSKSSITSGPLMEKILQVFTVSIERNNTMFENNSSDQMKYCRYILDELCSKEYADIARPFYQPVNALLYPDYYQVIKNPMDLDTIEKKMKSSMYESHTAFACDVRLMFQNCYRYYLHTNDFLEVKMKASSLQFVFEKMYAKMPDECTSLEIIYRNKPSKDYNQSSNSNYSGKENSNISLLEKQVQQGTKEPTVNEKQLCSDMKKLTDVTQRAITRLSDSGSDEKDGASSSICTCSLCSGGNSSISSSRSSSSSSRSSSSSSGSSSSSSNSSSGSSSSSSSSDASDSEEES